MREPSEGKGKTLGFWREAESEAPGGLDGRRQM